MNMLLLPQLLIYGCPFPCSLLLADDGMLEECHPLAGKSQLRDGALSWSRGCSDGF